MTIYQQGARVEREHCHLAIKDGALLSLRGAGSKSYGRYKIDVIDVFPKESELGIRLIQHKKKGYIPKTEIVKLLDLQRRVPNNVKVYVGTSSELIHIEDKKITRLLFE